MTDGPDLVVALPDGRTFVRRAPSANHPEPESWETWARYLAQQVRQLLADTGGDGVEAVCRRHAVQDAACDALLGWDEWSEVATFVGWWDQ